MFTPHNVSHVRCHMSGVRCQVSLVTCQIFGGASWWRVCYQRGLSRLVFLNPFPYSLNHNDVFRTITAKPGMLKIQAIQLLWRRKKIYSFTFRPIKSAPWMNFCNTFIFQIWAVYWMLYLDHIPYIWRRLKGTKK